MCDCGLNDTKMAVFLTVSKGKIKKAYGIAVIIGTKTILQSVILEVQKGKTICSDHRLMMPLCLCLKAYDYLNL